MLYLKNPSLKNYCFRPKPWHLRIVDQSFSLLFFKKQPEIIVTDFDFVAKTLISYFKFLVIPRDDMIRAKILCRKGKNVLLYNIINN